MEAARIEEALAELGGRVPRLEVVDVTASTNEDARRAAAAGAPHGAAFVADRQTSGRGRAGKRWHSPAGRNVYLSLVLKPELEAVELAPLSLVTGVAVARVVDQVLGQVVGPVLGRGQPAAVARATVKWPNDVYLDGRKTAGVLVEASTRLEGPPLVVVGVGLNVSSTSFPEDFDVPATSLALAGGRELDREHICAQLILVIVELAALFAEQGLGPFLAELSARDFLRGRQVTLAGLAGVAAGIDEQGRLRLRDARGEEHLCFSGEARWC